MDVKASVVPRRWAEVVVGKSVGEVSSEGKVVVKEGGWAGDKQDAEEGEERGVLSRAGKGFGDEKVAAVTGY